jgi:6-phosphofructokinase 1
MSKLLKGTAVVGQSGGPTAVINQSLAGVVQEARKYGYIEDVLGAHHGLRGIVDEDFIDLRTVPDDLLERVANTPAAGLGSTRDKPDPAYCERIFKVFARNNVRYFFYIGGNDSADTARILYDLSKAEGYDLRVYHIPKTIDNDLRVHDHSPGYGSAGKFVAAAILGDDLDNQSLPGVKINVVMGRNAGFLAAASVMGRLRDHDGPHLVYVPEAPLAEDKFLADVEAAYVRFNRCLIVVSEGIATPYGKTWVEAIGDSADKDSHGNIQLAGTGALADYMGALVKNKLGARLKKKLRVRSDTFGYLQRSFPGFVSPTDAAEARLVGRMAVQYSEQDAPEGSVAMRRLPGDRYQIETFLTPLHTVAREARQMDPSFIENGNNITEAFRRYARPLIGDLPVVDTLDEIPAFPKR